MRILMISKACIVGTYQRKLEALAQLPGIDLTVIVPPFWRDASGTLTLERVHTRGYRLCVEPMWLNGNFHLHSYPTLARRMAEIRPDIVHIDEEPYNLATWQALAAARRVGAKALFFSWQNLQRTYPIPFAWGERWTLDHSDYAIVGTASAAAVWRAKGYRGPLAVIQQFGVDPDFFSPAHAPSSAADLAKPRPDRAAFAIGYAGRLVPEKGVDVLLEAAARLPGDWRLTIVGQGPERGTLERLAARLYITERVTFGGQLASTRLADFYRSVDAVVVPSRTRPNWKEQFGRVLIEAMACGVPVVGSDSGAIPDVLADGGLIFPEGDAPALADRLCTLMADGALRQRLAATGRARVIARYTHAQVAAQTADVYRELIAKTW